MCWTACRAQSGDRATQRCVISNCESNSVAPVSGTHSGSICLVAHNDQNAQQSWYWYSEHSDKHSDNRCLWCKLVQLVQRTPPARHWRRQVHIRPTATKSGLEPSTSCPVVGFANASCLQNHGLQNPATPQRPRHNPTPNSMLGVAPARITCALVCLAGPRELGRQIPCQRMEQIEASW